MGQVIQGKEGVIRLMLLCFLAEGHLLVEDIPGVGKTSLAKALARSIDGTFGRIQCTPDLLPSDVTGIGVWDRAQGRFEFRPGPVFATIVLGDELNRAAPKTQSALLEAMAERQVTVDGTTHQLEKPFLVIATQNPAEHEGTFPLPDSQLDRFLMRVSVGYPAAEAETRMLGAHADRNPLTQLSPVMDAAAVRTLCEIARSVHVAPALRSYLVALAEATRSHPALALGMSPRATLGLQAVARARAAADGRGYVIPDDIKILAEPVLAHRLPLTTDARLGGYTAAHALAEVLQSVPVPTAQRAASGTSLSSGTSHH
jgi:MoxR-like ATPase